jgi:serine/threonine-protein kinase
MTETEQLYTGRRLGSYELLVPIAEGATAQVWAARMTGSRLEKIVAIKVLAQDLTSDVDAESMFLDEARLVSRIRHPNVASVLDFAEEGELLYIVIEWIEGEPLQVVLREVARSGTPRMPLPLAVRIVKLAASGLHAAHELCDESGKPVGLVHRDVSPGNLLVGYDGAVKVIDFGVAKAASNMQRTRVGQIKGKVPYMAPEQTAGDRVDRRTDVFALGVVLYQLVTGKHPFRGDNEFATMARIRDKDPAQDPRAIVPDLPPALVEVMRCALAKAREDRYETMHDFGRALEKALPSPPDVDRALGAFMGSVLSQRVAKRETAIREALRAVGERDGTSARPVNFGHRPLFEDQDPSGIRPIASLVDLESAAAVPAAPPASAPPRPALRAAPAAAPARDVDPAELPDGMRPSRPHTVKIVAAIAVVLLVAAALWIAGGSSSSEEPAPTKHAF